ncbi:MAG: chromate resistance protein ChrB domain-containing protein [Bacilli bacterium]
MTWVTWQRVGIDRMACAWLVWKYIDAHAEFHFLPSGQTVEESPDAIPFDIPGVRLSHHRGRCSFAAFLKEYGLTDPVLSQIARIVDGADCITTVIPPPESEGVEAICQGIRSLADDDLEALKQARLVFDALYVHLRAGTA